MAQQTKVPRMRSLKALQAANASMRHKNLGRLKALVAGSENWFEKHASPARLAEVQGSAARKAEKQMNAIPHLIGEVQTLRREMEARIAQGGPETACARDILQILSKVANRFEAALALSPDDIDIQLGAQKTAGAIVGLVEFLRYADMAEASRSTLH